jgi:hypothetical protein
VTATANQRVVPGTRALVFTGFSPEIQAGGNREVVPATVVIGLATFAPGVLISDHRRVVPDVASLALAGLAPDVWTPRTVIPAPVGLSITTYPPDAVIPGTDIVVTPATVALVLAGLVPIVGVEVPSVPDDTIATVGVTPALSALVSSSDGVAASAALVVPYTAEVT